MLLDIVACIDYFQTESYCTKVQGSTFGIPGVEKYAYPLRDIAHANAIRNKLIANWSLANTPNRQESTFHFQWAECSCSVNHVHVIWQQ